MKSAIIILTLIAGCLVGNLADTTQALATEEACTCTDTSFLLPPTAANEPPMGLFANSFEFNGVHNQTLVWGQNPINGGADANKPMLGLATELSYSPTQGNSFAEEYFVWEHPDGTQFRPLGFAGHYETKSITIGLYGGETVFLSDGYPPEEIARVRDNGQVMSVGGPYAGFYAAGANRLVIAADRADFINAPVIGTENGNELRLGGWGTWAKVTCGSPAAFTYDVVVQGVAVNAKLAELEARIAALESP